MNRDKTLVIICLVLFNIALLVLVITYVKPDCAGSNYSRCNIQSILTYQGLLFGTAQMLIMVTSISISQCLVKRVGK